MSQEDNGNIKMSVGLMPIVQSVKTASVGQTVSLQLITGLHPNELDWVCDDHIVDTLENSTVIFDQPGLYIPRVYKKTLLHVSYGINVVIQAPYTMEGL